MATTGTPLFSFWNQNFQNTNPYAYSAQATLQNYINYLNQIRSGSLARNTNFVLAYDQVRATGGLIAVSSLTGGDVVGATISGVDATATYATSQNNTMLLVKNKINAGGNTPNALISKAVSAIRQFQDAWGYFTHTSDTPGTVTPAIGIAPTNVAFTATGVDATDAATLAAAINANVTVAPQLVAFSDGVNKTYAIADSSNRGTISGISSLTAGGIYGVIIAGVKVTFAAGYMTFSGSSNSTTGYVVINGGSRIAFTEGASDTLTAVACAAAINADAAASAIVEATNVAGVVYIYARTGGTPVSITVSGVATGLTVNTTTITGAAGSNAVDSAALTWTINSRPRVNGLVRAINASSTTVAVIAKKQLSLTTSGTGVTQAGPIVNIASGSGAITATISGIATSVTWATTDAATATALAAAINANTQVNGKWVAYNPSNGYVIVQSLSDGDQMVAVGATGTGVTVGGVTTPLTTLTYSSASGTHVVYVNGQPVASVTSANVKTSGTITISSGAGTITGTVGGVASSVVWATSDIVTAGLLADAINASSIGSGVVAVASVSSTDGVVTITTKLPGQNLLLLTAAGTGATAGAAALASSATDWGNAVAFQVNKNFYARQYGVASAAAGVVTFTPLAAISFVGVNLTASVPYLTGSGTYGGIATNSGAGSAIALTTNDNCVRNAATFTLGVTRVLVTASAPGVSGNAITFAAGGAAATHVTASGARLGASPLGAVVAGAETLASFGFA